MLHTPIPRDIPLPLPAGRGLLEFLLVFSFAAHILFVNLMVGGSILVFGLQLRGLQQKDFDRLARDLAVTVTVNKSLAVVLGVAPLLLINVLYTMHFYTANALTGTAWILLVPAIAVTFLLLYLHKYSWDRLASQKGLHIAILGIAVALFLVIPLVFLANVNLMLFPERWTGVHGFLSALALPNVFPRYFHFLAASLIVTSLFGVYYFGREKYDDSGYESLRKADFRRFFYAIAFGVSLAQFVIGPLVLFTLPARGMHTSVLTSILLGATVAFPAVWLMWKELTVPEPHGKRLPFIVGYLSLTVLCMILGRHFYREVALAEHRAAMEKVTERWTNDAAQAEYDEKTGQVAGPAGSDGKKAFETTCAACHGIDKRIVGPPLTEIARIYDANPDGIVTWARAPGKKRADSPQMPAFAALGDKKLKLIADYMLEAGASH